MTESSDRAGPIAHIAVTGWFVLLACGLSYPLIFNLDTHVPGPPGDNLAFVWNFWWFRFAPGTAPGVFDCPYLLAPFGTSLVLHTHSALQAYLGATVLSSLSIVAAHNLVLIAGLAANGIATYALAYSFVRRVMPAVLAGVLFASSSYITLHLLGHFNLVHAWVLPLAALAWMRFLDRPSFARAALVAIAYAATMYSDYYYTVYVGLFSIVWTVVSLWSIRLRLDRPATRLSPVLTILMTALAAFIAIVLVTGGFDFSFAGKNVSGRHVRNPITALWLLVLLQLALRSRLRVRGRPGGGTSALGRMLPQLAAIAALMVVLALPLISGAAALVASGDYVAPEQRWLTSPGGLELVTLAVGNPLHAWYGSLTTRLYEHLGIGFIDQTAWIGLVPLIIGWSALGVGWQTDERSRRWWTVAAVFLIWSAGPFLHVAGQGTGIILPQFFLRFLPIVGNARIPGRGFVMVILAISVLCAIFVSRRQWRPAAIALLVAVALVDALVVPYPLSPVPGGGRIESHIAGDVLPGSVLELPVGLQDGFAQLGSFDAAALARQSHHQRPIVGGYVSRLPERIKTAYLERPWMAAFLTLSANPDPTSPVHLPENLAALLAADDVRFVVVDQKNVRRLDRPECERRGLQFVMREGTRELYRTK